MDGSRARPLRPLGDGRLAADPHPDSASTCATLCSLEKSVETRIATNGQATDGCTCGGVATTVVPSIRIALAPASVLRLGARGYAMGRRTEGPWSARSRRAQQPRLRKPVRVAATCSMRQCRYVPDRFRPHEMFARASYLLAALLRYSMASDSGWLKACAPARRSWNNRSALSVQHKPLSVNRLEPGHVFEVQRIR